MELIDFFKQKGNQGNHEVTSVVTSAGHATQGGSHGNQGNRDFNTYKVKIKDNTSKALINHAPIMVLIYTPAGEAFEVEARDEEHVAWLKKMNPQPP